MANQTSTTTDTSSTDSIASMTQPIMSSGLWMMALSAAISLAIIFVLIWIISKAWHLGAE